jgi:hypothetical protein
MAGVSPSVASPLSPAKSSQPTGRGIYSSLRDMGPAIDKLVKGVPSTAASSFAEILSSLRLPNSGELARSVKRVVPPPALPAWYFPTVRPSAENCVDPGVTLCPGLGFLYRKHAVVAGAFKHRLKLLQERGLIVPIRRGSEPPIKILGLGCGDVTESAAYEEHFEGRYTYHGVDIDPDYAPFLKEHYAGDRRFSFQRADARDPAQVAGEKYDLVVLRHPEMKEVETWRSIMATALDKICETGSVVMTFYTFVECQCAISQLKKLGVKQEEVCLLEPKKDTTVPASLTQPRLSGKGIDPYFDQYILVVKKPV